MSTITAVFPLLITPRYDKSRHNIMFQKAEYVHIELVHRWGERKTEKREMREGHRELRGKDTKRE